MFDPNQSLRRASTLSLLALTLMIQSRPALAQRVTQLSRDGAPGPNEVSVAIDPTDRDRIIAVSMQRGEQTSNVAYLSRDGGQSWLEVRGPNARGRTQGDDAIRFDASGRALWSYIAFDGLRTERPKTAGSGIFVNRSDDGGRHWTTTTVVDHINTVIPFEDKPYLTVDLEPSSEHQGNIYVAWTRFSQYGSEDPSETSDIYVSVSEDGGNTFSMPLRVSDTPGDAIDSDGTLEGAVPAVGPGGEFYLVWAGPDGLIVDRSEDGGMSFTQDRQIIETPGGWDIDVPGVFRANGMPVTGVDRSEGSERGRLYVNWIDERSGSLDAYVIGSSDGGRSWSEPVRVQEEGQPADQFLTWMAVDPRDGSVNVAFYDRSGLSGNVTGVSLARSIDGGRHFTGYRIAPGLLEPFQTNDEVFFGDYIGIDALDGRVVVAFSHFSGERSLMLSAALFDFAPGSHAMR